VIERVEARLWMASEAVASNDRRESIYNPNERGEEEAFYDAGKLS